MPGMPGMEGEKRVSRPSQGSVSHPHLPFGGGIKVSFSIMGMAEHKKMLRT